MYFSKVLFSVKLVQIVLMLIYELIILDTLDWLVIFFPESLYLFYLAHFCWPIGCCTLPVKPYVYTQTHVHYTNKLYFCIRCIMDNQAAMFTAQQMQYNKMYGMDPGRRMDELAAAQSQLRPGYGQHPWVKLIVFFTKIFCWLFFFTLISEGLYF